VKAVSATTRRPRPGEVDGVDYHFLDRPAFARAAANGEFLEWVEYSGNMYGTLRREVDDKLARGLDVILEIELQGARAVHGAMRDAVTIFVTPPSLAELRARLQGRATEGDDSIASRLRIAETEVAAASEFDFVVVNDEAEQAAARLAAIITDTRKGE
jgi:guanylate kinase